MLLPALRASFLLCLALSPISASALNPTDSHTQVELISPTQSVRPGEAFEVGVKFEMDPEWHLYWKNPGDTGEAPKVLWATPMGFKPVEGSWPAPERLPSGKTGDKSPVLMSYGFGGTVLLTTRMEPGFWAKLPLIRGRNPLELSGQVRWLACKDVCVPGKAQVHLTLPVSDQPGAPSAQAEIFETSRAKLPKPAPSDWKVMTEGHDTKIELRIEAPSFRTLKIRDAYFFPAQKNLIQPNAPQKVSLPQPGILSLTLKRPSDPAMLPQKLEGVLEVNGEAFALQTDWGTPAVGTPPVSAESSSLLEALFFALVGGLILNLMPCVFPVLSIKALSLLRHDTESDHRRDRKNGLFYTFGVLASFWALAGALLIFRSAGDQLGWGFQLQSPTFVAGLAAIFLVMALNLLGVFEIGGRWSNAGSDLAQREGGAGAFFSGVLAVVVAAPCTAPFMGTALGYAATQPAAIALLVFTALGIGLALPFLLLSIFPVLGRFLPRPGRWMESLKQFLAFPLLGTVIWLMSIVGAQTDAFATGLVWVGLLLVGLAAWIHGRWRAQAHAVTAAVVVLAVVLAGWATQSRAPAGGLSKSVSPSKEGIAWERFTQQKLEGLLAVNRPVFIDFTASWCVTCKVNEVVALGSPRVVETFNRLGITPLQADWTQNDPEITRILSRFGRNGVPLYVLYTGVTGEAPHVLPQILTPQLLIDELSKVKQGNQ